MTWFGWLLGRSEHQVPDPAQVREEMTRNDPDFAHVRQAHHEAMQALTAKRIADGIAIRKEREFWERYGAPPKRPDDG